MPKSDACTKHTHTPQSQQDRLRRSLARAKEPTAYCEFHELTSFGLLPYNSQQRNVGVRSYHVMSCHIMSYRIVLYHISSSSCCADLRVGPRSRKTPLNLISFIVSAAHKGLHDQSCHCTEGSNGSCPKRTALILSDSCDQPTLLQTGSNRKMPFANFSF